MAKTYVRGEYMLGPVFTVELDEETTGDQVTRTMYFLTVIDGWLREREWTDESGVVWEGSTPWRKAPVREVLNAAPDCTAFIVSSTLERIKALQKANLGHHAGAQRRALEEGLRHRGLALTAETKRMLADNAAEARRARRQAADPERTRSDTQPQAEP